MKTTTIPQTHLVHKQNKPDEIYVVKGQNSGQTSFSTPFKGKKSQQQKEQMTATSSALTEQNSEASQKTAASAGSLVDQQTSAKNRY